MTESLFFIIHHKKDNDDDVVKRTYIHIEETVTVSNLYKVKLASGHFSI